MNLKILWVKEAHQKRDFYEKKSYRILGYKQVETRKVVLIFGTTLSSHTYGYLASEKKGEEGNWRIKIFEEIMAKHIHFWSKTPTQEAWPTHSRTGTTPTATRVVRPAKTRDKEKKLKPARKTGHRTHGGRRFQYLPTVPLKHWRPEIKERSLPRAERIKSST